MAESCKVKILGKGGKKRKATDAQKVAIAACNKQKQLALKKKLLSGGKKGLNWLKKQVPVVTNQKGDTLKIPKISIKK
tara:strand:- start:406 stop:639 length:234 start_codon:yes stop_codon:yes gene_type:complete